MRGDFVWDIATAQFTKYDEDGFLGVQLDLHGTDNPGGPAVETHAPYGFVSRPEDPDEKGKGAQVLYAREGGTLHAWVLEDPRVASVLPELDKGGSLQHNALGSFDVFANKRDTGDGTKTIYVPVEFDGDGVPTEAITVTIGKDPNGKKVFSVLHSDGACFIMEPTQSRLQNKQNNTWIAVLNGAPGSVEINGDLKVNGNIGTGTALAAWMTDVVAKLTAAGFPPTAPLPTSLTV